MKHLARSLALVLAVPLLGALLAACGGEGPKHAEEAVATGQEVTATEPVASEATAGEDEPEATTEAEAEEEEPFVPARGCAACHVLIDAETGRYTLSYEAHERAEARGLRHPEVALDGTSMAPTDEVGLETCLGCHAPGAAPVLSMRDIVHPAHAFSEHFADERGNCFSCHTVSPQGTFDVIAGSLEVNEKGVPAPPPQKP